MKDSAFDTCCMKQFHATIRQRTVDEIQF